MLVSLVKYIPQGLICQLHLHIQGFKADRHGLWFDSMNLLRFRCQLQSSWANSSQESVTEVLSVIRDHTSGMPQACMPEFSWAFALHQVHTAPAQLTFGPRANCLLILICSYIFKLKLCKRVWLLLKIYNFDSWLDIRSTRCLTVYKLELLINCELYSYTSTAWVLKKQVALLGSGAQLNLPS